MGNRLKKKQEEPQIYRVEYNVYNPATATWGWIRIIYRDGTSHYETMQHWENFEMENIEVKEY